MTGLLFPEIDPVAFWIPLFGWGALPVRWYALAYMAGFLLGWWTARRLAPLFGLTKESIDDFLPWAVAGVILGGRLGYVIFYQPALFLSDPLQVFYIWQGGMAFHGGALGVIAAIFAYAIRYNLPPLRLADIVCCVVPIGLFFGRLANFINGELFGRVSDVPWAVRFPGGGYVPRHPSQLYEAVLEGALLFIILIVLTRFESIRNRPGILASIFLIGYGSFRFIVEYFREPDAHLGIIWGVFSMGQILSLPMVVLGLAVFIFSLRRAPQSQQGV